MANFTRRGIGPGRPDLEPVFPLNKKPPVSTPVSYFPRPSDERRSFRDRRLVVDRRFTYDRRSTYDRAGAEEAQEAWANAVPSISVLRRPANDLDSAASAPRPARLQHGANDSVSAFFEHEPPAVRYETQLEDDDDDLDELGVPRRLRAREILGRFFGILMVVGALYGCGLVFADSKARHEVLDWVTLGHADRATEVWQDLRSTVENVKFGRP